MNTDDQRKLVELLNMAAETVADARKQSAGAITIWVWVSSLCCAVSVAFAIGLHFQMVSQNQQIAMMKSQYDTQITQLQDVYREQTSYLAAIYARTGIQPHQQPENDNADADHP